MNFFHNINKNNNYPRFSSDFQYSFEKLGFFEKLILFHDQGAFSLIFIFSVVSHLILLMSFGIINELFKVEPPPIRAKVGVTYAKIASKPTLIKRSNQPFEKPVLKKLDKNFKPKYKNLVPKKPALKKPALKNSQNISKIPKPEFSNAATPRIEISKPQLHQTLTNRKKEGKILSPKQFNNLQKPILPKNNPIERTSNIENIPNFNKKNLILSPIKSSESLIKPKKVDVPRLPQENVLQKKLDPAKFSKSFKSSEQESPKINLNKLKTTPSISKPRPKNLQENFDNLFSDEQKKDLPLPENINIPENEEPKNIVSVPDIKDLQKRKETQLAIEDYNNHISNQIKPNGQFPSGLFVRFLLTIIPSGEIIKFEFIAKSGFSPFDLAAELAVRNAVLDELPQALAKNPPYIVPIRIVPQN